MKISLSRIHYPISTLGPGKRIGIWFQGCSIRCQGCISADTWTFGDGVTSVTELLDAISPWFDEADGITISGGEPFDQAESLRCVLQELKNRLNGTRLIEQDILVYSGYEKSEIEHHLTNMDGLIDALITGRFQMEKSQTLPLRGSDNQVLHTLTALGKERFPKANEALMTETKSLDIMFDDDNFVWIAGIPQRGELAQLSRILQLKGFETFTTEAGGGKY